MYYTYLDYHYAQKLLIKLIESAKWNQSQCQALLAISVKNIFDKTTFRYYLHMDVEALWDVFSDPVHFKIGTFKNVDSK